MSDSETRAVQAASFGAAAEAYERGRPEYPADAIDWLLPEDAEAVIDLGAGTGKLTRLLKKRAKDLVAIDPSQAMLAVLGDVVGGVETIVGTAEEIPIADGEADAVLCAQAWHWVEPERASAEVARVLKPGGTFGLVWNFRDEREDWVAELGRILGDGNRAEDIGTPEIHGPFGPLERFETTWTDELTRDEVVDLVFSRSYIITADDERRAEVSRQLDELLDGRGDTIRLPYTTVCFRTIRD
ncbi:class I SAM-dependent methyltransferase [Plantibacter sp. Mn2098]|uniref:class I SAM-dependent methyltransferase n=1 Tax=Plantibacter sp. Mn2098 TaxID=3395266 RepID=UPI003BE470F5